MLFSPNNCKNSRFETIIKDKITINKENKTNNNLNLINLINTTNSKPNLNLNSLNNNQNAIINDNLAKRSCQAFQETQERGRLLLVDKGLTSFIHEEINLTDVNTSCNPLGIDIYNKELNQINDNIYQSINNSTNLNNLLQQKLNQDVYSLKSGLQQPIDQFEYLNQQLLEQINNEKITQNLLEQFENNGNGNKQLLEQVNNNEACLLMTPNTPLVNQFTNVSSPDILLYDNNTIKSNENIYLNSPLTSDEKIYLESPESCCSSYSNDNIKTNILTPEEIIVPDFTTNNLMVLESPDKKDNVLEVNNLKTILEEQVFNNGLEKANILNTNGTLATELNNAYLESIIKNQQEILNLIKNQSCSNSPEMPFENENMITTTPQMSMPEYVNPMPNNQFSQVTTEYNSPLFNDPLSQISTGYTSPLSLSNDQLVQSSMLFDNNNLNLYDMYLPLDINNKEEENEKFSNKGFEVFSKFTTLNDENKSMKEKMEEINKEKSSKKEEQEKEESKLNVYMEGKPFIYVETYDESDKEDDDEEEEEEEENIKEEKKGKKVKKYKKKYYVCSICHHKSKRHYNIEVHMKTHQKNRPRPFKCETCNKCFCRQHDLKRHEIVHNDKMYNCPLCDKKFGRMDSLKRHVGCKSCKNRQTQKELK